MTQYPTRGTAPSVPYVERAADVTDSKIGPTKYETDNNDRARVDVAS